MVRGRAIVTEELSLLQTVMFVNERIEVKQNGVLRIFYIRFEG